MKTIDTKGLKCPMPLIETKKALKESETGEAIKILIDNETSVKNVLHYLSDNKIEAADKKTGYFWEVLINKSPEIKNLSNPQDYCEIPSQSGKSYALMLAKDRLGEGSNELGEALVGALLNTVNSQNILPSKILFMNSGINLVCKGSLVLHILKELEEKGVDLISCGTCLDYYGKMDELEIGRASNMLEIFESMRSVEQVINI